MAIKWSPASEKELADRGVKAPKKPAPKKGATKKG